MSTTCSVRKTFLHFVVEDAEAAPMAKRATSCPPTRLQSSSVAPLAKADVVSVPPSQEIGKRVEAFGTVFDMQIEETVHNFHNYNSEEEDEYPFFHSTFDQRREASFATADLETALSKSGSFSRSVTPESWASFEGCLYDMSPNRAGEVSPTASTFAPSPSSARFASFHSKAEAFQPHAESPKEFTAKAARRIQAPSETSSKRTLDIPNGVTTLMVTGIPCRVGHGELRQVVEDLGFRGKFDLLWMPSRGYASNLGYGFVNFLDTRSARAFAKAFVGFRFGHTHSTKQCGVKVAESQGRNANWSNFCRCRRSSQMH